MLRIICLASAILLAVHCGQTRPAEPELLVSVPLIPDGETNTYRVVIAGDSIGTYTTTASHGRFKDIPAYEVVLVARTRTGDVTAVDSSVIYVSRDSMVPLSSFRFIKTGGAMVTTAANYGPDMIAISAFSQGEETQRMLPAAPATFDADQLTFLGRALQVSPERPQQITIVSPMGPPPGGRLRNGEFRAKGDENIVVPAGTFECYRYELEVDGSIIDLWYDRAGARKLVRYHSAEAGMSMELLPAAPDSGGPARARDEELSGE